MLDIGDQHVVKGIVVTAGERLSLQYHNHRSERWTAVSGCCIAEIDGTEHVLQLGHTVNIFAEGDSPGLMHQRYTTGFIEIQYGKLLDENDIVRISDDYNRL